MTLKNQFKNHTYHLFFFLKPSNITLTLFLIISMNITMNMKESLASISETVLSTCPQSIPQMISSYLNQAPKKDSNLHLIANNQEREALLNSIKNLAVGNTIEAINWASQAKYSLCLGIQSDQTEKDWIFIYPQEVNGEAMVIYNASTASEPLVIEAPHVFFDTNTYPQSLALFRSVGAKALIINGASRCANFKKSGCDGYTSACSSSNEAYRESDVAHNPFNQFHTIHQALSQAYLDHLFISVHGFVYKGASLSDGTTFSTTSNSPVALFHKALQKTFPKEYMTTCNSYHRAKNVNKRMCGTTNVQARELNGVINSCTVSANKSLSRFIHMEQSGLLRKSENYSLMSSAIKSFLDQWKKEKEKEKGKQE